MERVVDEGFHRRVYAVVRLIPAGRVATYGDVGAALGSSRVARHVGWALAALRDEDVPWQRVINAKGQISGRGEIGRARLQEALLKQEGIEFRGACIDLATLRHVFDPETVEAAVDAVRS